MERIGGPEEPVDWTSPSAIDSVARPTCGRAVPWRGSSTPCPWEHRGRVEPIETDWSGRVGVEVKGLFLLAKATAADLENAAQAGGACLIAATALGGRFASAGCSQRSISSPATAESPGWSRRWPENGPSVRCRVVDFSPGDPIETVAGRLADEVFVE